MYFIYNNTMKQDEKAAIHSKRLNALTQDHEA